MARRPRADLFEQYCLGDGRVRTPAAQRTIDHAEIAAAYGAPVHLMQLYQGTFDAADISLITESSVTSVEALVGSTLDIRRFRANIIVASTDNRPYPEDRWVGHLLVFGDRATSLRMRCHRKNVRCAIVNYDPDTAAASAQVLMRIVTERRNQVGIYGGSEFPRTVEVGDPVYLVRRWSAAEGYRGFANGIEIGVEPAPACQTQRVAEPCGIALRLIKEALDQRPSRINTRLVEAAGALRVRVLVRALETLSGEPGPAEHAHRGQGVDAQPDALTRPEGRCNRQYEVLVEPVNRHTNALHNAATLRA